MKRALVIVLLFAACRPASIPAPVSPTTRLTSATAIGTNGMVASDAPLASLAGVEILRAGGNAADAAVAVGFALAVVYPEAGNLGGGGFALVRMADGRVASIDYREVAPLAGTRDMFLDDSGRITQKSTVGPLASGVPGAVAGLVGLHQRFGALSLARVMAPAIRLADQGFVVDSQLAGSLSRHARLIGQFAGAAVFLPNGQPLAAGTTLRLPALARTLRAIADSSNAFYTGTLARDVAKDLQAAGTIITAEDLAKYKAEWREPLRGTYRGHTVMTMPPPSSGVIVLETLNILEGFAPLPPYGSARQAHLVAAALQRAFVDRNLKVADPAFARVPVAELSNKSYAAKLRATIGDRATPTATLMQPAPSEGSHTTHYSVVDAAGNAVSTTTTINDLYGSGVYLPTVGFFMNDEMDDFAARPGFPNNYGVVQGEQNAIQPGKRMLSSMSPTIVVDRVGQPLLIVGGRGGPRIISAVAQTIVNVIDHRMSVADAVNAPRVHHQSLPDSLIYEEPFAARLPLDSLTMLGYALKPMGNIASVNAILRTAAGWVGHSDPRSGGKPAGY